LLLRAGRQFAIRLGPLFAFVVLGAFLPFASCLVAMLLERTWPPFSAGAECLTKDRDALLTFYDFPAEHWKYLRTTNPIESTFATVRHRTIRSKGCLSNRTALAMVFKLVEAAQKSWRRLDGHNQLPPSNLML
jgi:transposase-like protein